MGGRETFLRTDAVRKSLMKEVKFEMGGIGRPWRPENEGRKQTSTSWSRAVVVAADISLNTLTL